jgi:putative ATPase
VPRTRRPTDPGKDTLFEAAVRRDPAQAHRVPLAERMRPRTLAELVGQAHLFGPNRLLGQAVASDRVPSMILWGPPGVGKTTVGHVIAELTQAVYVPFSAVLGNLQDLREIVAQAKERRTASTRPSKTPFSLTSRTERSPSSAPRRRTPPSP